MIYNAEGLELYKIFDAFGAQIDKAYNISGEQVFSAYNPTISFLHSFDMSEFDPDVILSPQGMAITGNNAFQYFTGNDSLHIINLVNFTIDGGYTVPEFVHGNGLVFGDAAQSSGFPLLYASQFGETAQIDARKIAIAEVGTGDYRIVGYYDIPQNAGYHPQFMADWTNGKGYTIGYQYLTTESGNYMTISEYNISDMSTIIKSWTIPYIGVIQGSCFWHGYIIIVTDSYNYAKVKINFINIENKTLQTYEFTKQQDHQMEFQGIDVLGNDLIVSSWIYDDSDGQKLKYCLYKITLPDVEQ